MGRTHTFFAALLVTVLSSSCGETENRDVETLKREWEDANGKCRGGSGDNPDTLSACDRRDKLTENLESSGWCYTSGDEPAYASSWRSCPEQASQEEGEEWTDSLIGLDPSDFVNISEGRDFNRITGQQQAFIQVQSVVDELNISDVRLNKGNCEIVGTSPTLPAKLAYGQTIKVVPNPFRACSVIRIDIETEHGTLTISGR